MRGKRFVVLVSGWRTRNRSRRPTLYSSSPVFCLERADIKNAVEAVGGKVIIYNGVKHFFRPVTHNVKIYQFIKRPCQKLLSKRL